MIAAFPQEPSVVAGGVLELCAAGTGEATVRFVRAGARCETMREHAGSALSLERAAAGDAHVPWSWPVYRFEIPRSWRPGAYVAVLELRDSASTDAALDARSARALFVVRPRAPASALLYHLPLFTYHAYNVATHDPADQQTCLYNDAKSVTLRRPGGGIGGHTWDEGIADVYDTGSPRQTFAHWDLPAIAWLESHGYVCDYATDLDLHRDGDALLSDYRCVVGFGHHEYWSDAMRAALDRHIARGANAAWFTGNTCYFRIRFDNERHAISRIGKWSDADSEARTFGVSYRYGGGKWRGARPPAGFGVRDASHWLFDSTGLRNGDTFGTEQRLAGYECDGRPDGNEHERSRARAEDGFAVVADADLRDWPVSDGSGELNDGARACFAIREGAGTLLCAGTVDWPRVLAGGEPAVTAITRNAIEWLSR